MAFEYSNFRGTPTPIFMGGEFWGISGLSLPYRCVIMSHFCSGFGNSEFECCGVWLPKERTLPLSPEACKAMKAGLICHAPVALAVISLRTPRRCCCPFWRFPGGVGTGFRPHTGVGGRSCGHSLAGRFRRGPGGCSARSPTGGLCRRGLR